MLNYLLRRLLLVIPTLFGILLINFFIVQSAPGGPVDQTIARLQGQMGNGSRIGAAGNEAGSGASSRAQQDSIYRGSQGLSPDLIAQIKKQYGFDQPASTRFWIMVRNYLHFDFGTSFYRDTPVARLILEKMPVSLSLGLWSTLVIYLVSIPLGIAKALYHGQRFDVWTSALIIVGKATDDHAEDRQDDVVQIVGDLAPQAQMCPVR